LDKFMTRNGLDIFAAYFYQTYIDANEIKIANYTRNDVAPNLDQLLQVIRTYETNHDLAEEMVKYYAEHGELPDTDEEISLLPQEVDDDTNPDNVERTAVLAQEKPELTLRKRLMITIKYFISHRLNQDPYSRKKTFFSEKETLGFNTKQQVQGTTGNLIEVGGPTSDDYKSLDVVLNELDRKVEITNLYPDSSSEKKVDARRLSYPKGSLGVIFSSALFENVYSWMFLSASRSLEDGGLLVMQHITAPVLENAIEMGFTPKVIRREGRWENDDGVLETYNVVLRK